MNIVKPKKLTEEDCRARIGPIIQTLTRYLEPEGMAKIVFGIRDKCGTEDYQCIINEWNDVKRAFIKKTGIKF